ncbi:hypothetical protein A2230_04325 [candidate division WOR-1 bacterium RIFOXYA2_FULL_36_21]|uniref:VWFA domain-containing protein n=1 Tax=candidate division WOR-1 bacterium RIFOXYB2_FULL_36_35 TaxID=1802578 RepID=A0A1F4S8F9_UNCSA|nr:MAG: hypothetical protein A2230_04325 [candidate division WOR-1 bacterium RIFOXYA2_FULL_36_21]OGC15995.1 MAG: hypothetical protein A2282_05055 [candidate division WOR-1 bacterium RIFOXYA12_FULL_36_13]OGC16710.1 MAG: hypothetical protein A2290_09365 [candidate division WOR-1 bacterium RIFOXYB2_FULL_36_35]
MGGWNYEPSYTRTSSSNYSRAQSAQQTYIPKIDRSTLVKPFNRATFPHGRTLKTQSPCPVALLNDVSGSMEEGVVTIRDKIPMIVNQTITRGYLDKPAFSLFAVSDARTFHNGEYIEDYPFQVTDFAEGDTLDNNVELIWLPRPNGVDYGGGQGMETYEMAAWFYLNRCELQNKSQTPFLFITGDEGYYPEIYASLINRHFGAQLNKDLKSLDVFLALSKKFECFIFRKTYQRSSMEAGIQKAWVEAFGSQKVLMLNDWGQIADSIIGAIAICRGCETLQSYLQTLREGTRKQSEERIKNVRKTLIPYAEHLDRV